MNATGQGIVHGALVYFVHFTLEERTTNRRNKGIVVELICSKYKYKLYGLFDRKQIQIDYEI